MSSLTPNYNLTVCTGSDLVNPLTQIFPNFTSLDTILRNIANTGITTATEVKTGTVHALTRSDTAVPMIRFQAVSRFDSGDTFTVDGVTVTATLPDGETLPDGGYIIGSMVLCELRDTQLTVYTSDSIANVNAAFNIGNTDISGIGDGSIKGAISALNTNLTYTELTNPISGSVGSISVDNFIGYKHGNHYHIECALHTLTSIPNAYSQPLFTCTGLPIISGNMRVGLATKDGSAFAMCASLHTDGYFYQIISNTLDANTSIGIVADFIV